MRTIRHSLLTICAIGILAGTCSVAQAQQASGGTKVAVCNIMELFQRYDRAVSMLKKIQQRQMEINGEKDRRSAKLQAEGATLQDLIDGSDAYETQLLKIQKMKIELDLFVRLETAKNVREHQKLTREIYEDILDAVAQFAKSKGIDLVVYSYGSALLNLNVESPQEMLRQIQNRRVLYAVDKIDITGDVLIILNGKFKQAGN